MKKNIVQTGHSEQVDNLGTSGVALSLVLEPEKNKKLLTPSMIKLLEALARAIVHHQYITIVKGDSGSGKSTLFNLLVKQSSPDWVLCLIHARHVIGEGHILVQLNQDFQTKSNYDLDGIVDYVSCSEQTQYVILIDDAHNLSPFALALLISLQSKVNEKGGALGIVLFAQPKIQRNLELLSIKSKSDLVRTIEIPVLTQQQTEDFIGLLISMHYQRSLSKISADQAKSIFKQSRGLPGAICHLVKFLYDRHDSQQKKLGKGVGISIVAGLQNTLVLGVLVISVGAIILYLQTRPSGENMPDLIAPSGVLKNESPGIGRVPRIEVFERVSTPSINIQEKETRSLKGLQVNRPETNRKTAPVNSQIKSVIPLVLPKTELPSPVEKITLIQPEKKVIKDVARNRKVQKELIKVDTNLAVIAVESRSWQLEDERNWLMGQEGNRYTIQLAASPSRSEIERFIKRQPPLSDLHFVHIKKRNRDWYVSIYGSFENLAAAKSAETALPSSMTRNKPWIRPIAQIKAKLVLPSVPSGNKPEQIPEVVTVPVLNGAVSEVTSPATPLESPELEVYESNKQLVATVQKHANDNTTASVPEVESQLNVVPVPVDTLPTDPPATLIIPPVLP